MLPRTRLTLVLSVLVVVSGLSAWVCRGGEGDAWALEFLADFSGQPDGPVLGDEFSTEIGRLGILTGNGRPLSEVAPQSGIDRERLLLTDRGGRRDVAIGVHAQIDRPSEYRTHLAFDITLLSNSTSFVAEVTDTTGVDISIGFQNGGISVNRVPVLNSFGIKVPYRVEALLVPLYGRADVFLVTITDLDTKAVIGEWSGPVPGGIDPVTGLLLMKRAESPGGVLLDNIMIHCSDR